MERDMNPFDVLGATPRDTRVQLASLAQKAALLGDAAQAEAARMALTRPETRLSAEIRWISRDGEESRSKLDALNREAERADIKQLQSLCGLFAKTDVQAMLSVINEDRKVSGFREATEEAVQKARREYAREIASRLMENAKTLKTQRLTQLLCDVCTSLRKQEQLIGNALLEEVLDAYDLHIAPEASPMEEQLLTFVACVLEQEPRKWKRKVKAIARDVRAWSRLMEPMCIYEDARGMQHQRSLHVLDKLEDAYIQMVNQYRSYKQARRLITAMHKGFTALSQHVSWLETERKRMDLVALSGNAAKKKEPDNAKNALIKLALILLAGLLLRMCAEDTKPKPRVRENYPLTYQQVQDEMKRANELAQMVSLVRISSLKEQIEEVQAQMTETMERYAESRSPYDLALHQKLKEELAQKQGKLDLEYENYQKLQPIKIPGLPY